MHEFLRRCDERAAEGWARIHAGAFWRRVREHGFERGLYVQLMTEIYHYTRHNAQNQALAAVRVHSDRLPLLRFCLHHAYEEAGHDLMVLHDLQAIGVDPDAVRAQKPLPETEAFIAYLYRVATTLDATARLGYSYWAESCYGHIQEVLDAMRSSLGLGDREMTFFVAHSEIDRSHFEEVQKIAVASCTDGGLQEDLLDVLERSLHLQGQMLEGVLRACTSRPEPALS